VIVDSSAFVALLYKEAGFERLLEAMLRSKGAIRVASPNLVETTIVVDGRRDPTLARKFDDLIDEFEIEIIPFTAEHARMARDAYRDYGKGSGHPARLNFGDAMAYAVARSEREPLLFVGDDFTHTDIEAA
jgi:ribonuclease VapC